MAVIFTLSSISGLRVTEDADVDRPLRALGHVATYAFLAGLVLYAVTGLARPSRRDIVVALVVTLLYGLSDEIHQANVPDRKGRIEDLFIDAVGILIGLALAGSLLSRRVDAGSPTESGSPATGHTDDQRRR